MPDFYADDMFEIQEADEFYVDEDSFEEDFSFYVDEEDNMEDNVLEVDESDDLAMYSKMLPGSDYALEDNAEDVEEEKDTDWPNDRDHSKFIVYLRDKMKKVPRHSGRTVPGCERAISYLKSLDSEISQAMKSDLEGVIDEQECDSYRVMIMDGVQKLEDHVKRLRKNASLGYRLVAKGECNKCGSGSPMWLDAEAGEEVCLNCNASAGQDESLTKEAATPVINVYITPFERAIVGTMINSKVQAGRNIEETYNHLKNTYNFSPREELAIQQLVADYGYPVFKDRGRLNQKFDHSAGDGIEFQTNYYA